MFDWPILKSFVLLEDVDSEGKTPLMLDHVQIKLVKKTEHPFFFFFEVFIFVLFCFVLLCFALLFFKGLVSFGYALCCFFIYCFVFIFSRQAWWVGGVTNVTGCGSMLVATWKAFTTEICSSWTIFASSPGANLLSSPVPISWISR